MENNSNEIPSSNSKLPSCACKGIRTCIICEISKNKIYPNYNEVINLTNFLKINKEPGIKSQNASDLDDNEKNANRHLISHYYLDDSLPIKYSNFNCILNNSIESTILNLKNEINFTKNKIKFSAEFNNPLFEGFYIIQNFISNNEETQLIKEINSVNWKESQSGRKKQDLGPKINYKKRKVKYDGSEDKIFTLIPEELRHLVFQKLPFIRNYDSTLNLEDFKVAGVGNLFYSNKYGSHIDPHIDDYWVWGPRIIGVNLLSDTVMTFSHEVSSDASKVLFELDVPIHKGDIYVLSGKARYIWKHSIKRENILSDRIAITIRELEQGYKEKIFK